MYPLPEILTAFQAPVEFVDEVADFHFRSIIIQRGEYVEQHQHPYGHATYCGNGAARLWVDGLWVRDIFAGQAVEIEAHKKHAFQALLPDTRLTCVHDLRSAAYIKEQEQGD